MPRQCRRDCGSVEARAIVSQAFCAADKIVSIDGARAQVRAWLEVGERVVVASGVFDLVQAGHVRALARARALGDRLVVCLLDDRATGERLGKGRPLVPAAERARVCAALRVVDRVTIASGSDADALRAERGVTYARGTDSALAPFERGGAGPLGVDVGERGSFDLLARLRAGGGA
jgi:cytidyltransferase-like protein